MNESVEKEIISLLKKRESKNIYTELHQVEEHIESMGGNPAEGIADLIAQGLITVVTKHLVFSVDEKVEFE